MPDQPLPDEPYLQSLFRDHAAMEAMRTGKVECVSIMQSSIPCPRKSWVAYTDIGASTDNDGATIRDDPTDAILAAAEAVEKHDA